MVESQKSEAITCLVIKEEIKYEDVEEVNSYKSWDVFFEMNLKDDDGLHEDLVSDVWYAKENLYSVVGFTIGVLSSTRLDEDETKFIVEAYFQQ